MGSRVDKTVGRQWGYYEVVHAPDMGRYKVKELTVMPGKFTSLQRHNHRMEHWVIVRGTATIKVGTLPPFEYYEGEHVHIPEGEWHQLTNNGVIPLHVIEVQWGSYLGEDDIERAEPPQQIPITGGCGGG